MARNALTLIALAVMTSPTLAASSHLAGRTGGGHHGSSAPAQSGFCAAMPCLRVEGISASNGFQLGNKCDNPR